ncbi:MAG: PD40 domain-containing protein [Planctomycetes bacterium]|nr:PD40 domain-containing protein [Planctomycetota bacterium]MCB9891165.1 PD40 domain-containing protein [Planctomycetota bacterium]MCB9918932.1 PD40 domain-containing protein [Planctomycetota bacterium]
MAKKNANETKGKRPPRSKKRRIFALAALLVFFVALLGLVMLRSGRPIWYSSGVSPRNATTLRDASMLVFDTPMPATELTGDIRGRTCALPDGRILYARKCGTPIGAETELVIFDPERPRLEPEMIASIDGPSHDLAPAFGIDGRLYFASDRPGGAGGFDLWSARWNGRGFDDVRPLPAGINTPLDETDPAPHPDGVQIAFSRRDPEIARGAHGVLYLGSLASRDVEVHEVFDDIGDDGPYPTFFDRDCSFDARGEVLYFVRRFESGRRRLFHTWLHPSESGVQGFVAPLPVPGFADLGRLRGPRSADDGRGLFLVDESSGIQYRADSRLVRPWWLGQRNLEWVLAIVAAMAFLLFVMFWLGGRWTALDVITQCLLASLLIHLLLLLWLMRVEIVRTFLPPVPEVGDRVEVRLMSSAELTGERAPDEAPARAESDLGQRREFEGFERDLAPVVPQTSVATAARDGQERAEFLADRSRELTTEVAKLDAPTTEARAVTEELPKFAPKSGQDTTVAPDAIATTAEQAKTEAADPQRAAERAVIEVAIPSASTLADATPKSGETAARSVPAASRDVRAQEPVAIAIPTVETDSAFEAVEAKLGMNADPAMARPAAASTSTARLETVPDAERVADSKARDLEQQANLPAPDAVLSGVTSKRPGPERMARVAPAVTQRELSAREPQLRDTPDANRVASAKGRAKSDETGEALTAKAATIQRASSEVVTAAANKAEAERPVDDIAAEIAPPSTDFAKPRTRRAPPARTRDGRPLVANGPRPGLAPAIAVDTPVDTGAIADAPKPGTALDESRVTARELVTKADEARAAVAQPQRALDAQPAPSFVEGASVAPPEFDLAKPRVVRVGGRSERVARARPMSSRRVSVPATAVAVNAPIASRAVPIRRATEGPPSVSVERVALPRIQKVETLPSSPVAMLGDERRRDGLDAGSVLPPSTQVDRAQRRVRVVPVTEKKPAEVSLYANRFGKKKVEALARFGGTEETELAVQKGLRYLAKIQRDDGGWGEEDDYDEKYGEVRVGKSALCLLAFLGAGNLPPTIPAPGQDGDPVGKGQYATNVARAIRFLLASQDEDTGHFGRSSSYSHGITTYALAECYALTKLPWLQKPLSHAVDWILEQQRDGGPRHSRGGWGYYSPTLKPEDPYSRASVSSWQIMALESARRSGLDVPERALAMAKGFLLEMFDDRYGYFLYTKEPQRLQMTWRTLPASTPASVFCLLLLGQDPEDPRIETGLRFTTDRRIEKYARASDDDFVQRGAGNPYFWYYGTLACFFRGGDAWRLWNEKLRVELPRGQSSDGSFAPVGAYARYAKDTRKDRSYTTAMCVLSLEVYYRYFTPLLEKRGGKVR